MTRQMHLARPTQRARRIVIVALMAIMAIGVTSLAHDVPAVRTGPLAAGRASALPPSVELCSSTSGFCGMVIRIESSTGIIESVAAGAHWGAAWGIPATPNDSAGTGWCVDDTHTGFPAGPISEQPLPTEWSPYDKRLAATIISLYGGDRVLPYQPLEIDASGEIVVETAISTSPTRLRHVAVWLALRSVLPDPAGTPRIDLDSAIAFSDRAGRTPSPTGTAAIPLARQMVEAARRATPQGGDPVMTVDLTPDQRAADVGTVIQVPVRVTDPTGRPIPHVPVWPHGITNAAITPQAGDDHASLQATRNAVLAGWPSFATTQVRPDAALTDANGVVLFDLHLIAPAEWSASFSAETAPTGLLLFGDDIRAQNNVTLRGGTETLATASIEGDATQRHIRVVKTTTDPARSVAGATFALLDADDTEVDRMTTGDDGIVDFVVAASHPAPLRIRELVAPPGLLAVVGDIEVVARDVSVSTDPSQPTIVTVENEPIVPEAPVVTTTTTSTTVPPTTSTTVPPTTSPPPPTTPPSTTPPPTTPPPTTTPPTTTPPTTTLPPTTTTTMPPTTTSTTVVEPPPDNPPSPAPRATAPVLPRTGGDAWELWFRLGTWILLAGAAFFFASTIGLGVGSGRDQDPRPGPARTTSNRGPS